MIRPYSDMAHRVDPMAIGTHLWEFAIPFLIGLCVGAVALFLLQRAKLRWTWALLAVPLAYLLWYVDWQVALALSAATLTVVGFGAKLQIEAYEHGGEEARESRETTGPLGWALARARSRGPLKPPVVGERMAVGVTRRRGTCYVPFGATRGVHAVVLGATGAGKTVTQAAFLQAYVRAGQAVIVVDPKGDRFLRAIAQDAARKCGVRFVEWAPTGSTVYNPFGRGGPTEITDKALAGHRWTEPHYELATQRLLLHVLKMMQAARKWPPTLSQIAQYMDPERLDYLAAEVGGEAGKSVLAYLDALSARARSDLGGGRDRLAVLADGELGPRLDPALGDGELISLEESLKCRDVVYFHIDADRYPAASKLLAAALMIDLVTLTADLQGGALRGLIVIDEFAAIAAEQVSRLFGRARSAGLSLLLGTQSLADLRVARPEDPSDTLTEQVLTNIEFAIVHREGDPDSAERLARMVGTRPTWSTTQRVGGPPKKGFGFEGTRTREREFIVLPDQFKRLRVGEAVVINLTAKVRAQVARIWPPRARF